MSEYNVSKLDMNISNAMHRIERLYYDTNGKCYLSFSGGKDSTIVLAVIKLCENIGTIPKNAIPAVFCDTKIELDATVEFVHWVKDNWYNNVQGVKLLFDEEYMKEYKEKWIDYENMRYEMLKKYRPDCMICIKYEKEVNK